MSYVSYDGRSPAGRLAQALWLWLALGQRFARPALAMRRRDQALVARSGGQLDAKVPGKAKKFFPGNPYLMAMEAIERGCVMQIADDFEKLAELDLVLSSPGRHGGAEEPSLRSLLEKRWILEDHASANNGNVTLRAQLQEAKEDIRAWHFSVTGAKEVCFEMRDEVQEDIIQGCVLELARTGKVVKKKGLMTGGRASLSSKSGRVGGQSPDSGKLEQSLKEVWEFKKELRILKRVLNHEGSRQKVTRIAKLALGKSSGWLRGVSQALAERKAAELKLQKSLVKKTGFSAYYAEESCKRKHKHESMSTSARLLERILREVVDGAAFSKLEAVNCREAPENYCPEGTSPQAQRIGMNHKRFAKVFGVMMIPGLGIAVQASLAFLIGFLIGGPPVGILLATTVSSIPGLPIITTTLPLAFFSSLDVIPKCRCLPNPCEYNQRLGACAMRTEGRSSNPFQWLPYPGAKCVQAPGAEDTAWQRVKKTDGYGALTEAVDCRLEACYPDDYRGSAANFTALGGRAPLTGTVGVVRGEGTYNCLRAAEGDEVLLTMKTLDVGTGAKRENSVKSRTALYSSLGLKGTPLRYLA